MSGRRESRLWTVNYSLSIGIGVVLFALLFPDGRFVPRWTRWVALAAILEEVVTLAWPDSRLAASAGRSRLSSWRT